MRRIGAGIGVVALMGTLLVFSGSPAGAASAKGCSGSGISLDDSGVEIDKAAAPGRGGTLDNPFDVTADGRVTYEYDVTAPVAGGRWTVSLDTGLPIIGAITFSGKVSNDSQQSGSGVEPLKKHLKFAGLAAMVGLLKVKIVATGPQGGRCEVNGYIKIHNSLFTTPAFYLAVIFLVIGLLLALFGEQGLIAFLRSLKG